MRSVFVSAGPPANAGAAASSRATPWWDGLSPVPPTTPRAEQVPGGDHFSAGRVAALSALVFGAFAGWDREHCRQSFSLYCRRHPPWWVLAGIAVFFSLAALWSLVLHPLGAAWRRRRARTEAREEGVLAAIRAALEAASSPPLWATFALSKPEVGALALELRSPTADLSALCGLGWRACATAFSVTRTLRRLRLALRETDGRLVFVGEVPRSAFQRCPADGDTPDGLLEAHGELVRAPTRALVPPGWLGAFPGCS